MVNKIGYARVSTKDKQDIDKQIYMLEKDGCVKIYQDKISGSVPYRKRPGLNDLINNIRDGEILVFYKLDRLSRSTKDFLNLFELLKKKNIKIRSLTEPIDSSTPIGEAMVKFISVFAELEKNIIRERVIDGIAIAKEKGVKFGRKTKITKENIKTVKDLKKAGWKVKDIMNTINVKSKKVYYKIYNLSKDII